MEYNTDYGDIHMPGDYIRYLYSDGYANSIIFESNGIVKGSHLILSGYTLTLGARGVIIKGDTGK